MADTFPVARRRRAAAGCLALAATALGALAAPAAATDVYVAPNGSDAGAGTLTDPFKTLQRAQQAVRAATPSMRSDVVVHLRGGTYRMRAPLALDDALGDSGQHGHDVVWQAYGYGTRDQEAPVLTGGRRIRGWTLVDAGANVWKAEIGRRAPRQLYRDGVRLEQGAIDAIPGTVTRTSTGYTTTSTAPQSWADPSNVELVVTTTGYAQGICGVASVSGDGSGSTITMDQPCWRRLVTHYTFNEADPRAPLELNDAGPIRNSRSFLDRAGTWAIDRATAGAHVVYYRAATGEDPNRARFEAPQRQTLVSGVGTQEDPLHDVAFKGLTFEHATWTRPNRPAGFVGIFGDYFYLGGSPSGGLTEPTTRFDFVPGNLDFRHAQRLLFEGNRFDGLGGDAVDVTGSRDNVFRGNVFEQLAGGAVKLDGLNDGSDAGNLMENNWIHDVGNDYQQSIAVYWEDVVESTFQHNQIDDVPYSGISHTISEAEGHGVQILDNEIFDTVNVLMDGGGIYTSNAQGTSYETGALIQGNEVYEAINPAFAAIDPRGEIGAPNAIYTDVGADWITLRDNVIYDSHQTWGGVFPVRMSFTDNWWDDDDLVFYGETDGLTIEDNTLLDARDPRGDCEAQPACDAILDSAGLEPAWQHLLAP
jgi:hypothetical protein